MSLFSSDFEATIMIDFNDDLKCKYSTVYDVCLLASVYLSVQKSDALELSLKINGTKKIKL